MSNDTPLVVRAYNLGLKAAANFHTVLTPDQVEYYEQHLGEIPTALKRGFVVPDKFSLLADLGIITVPNNYVHAIRLGSFARKHREQFRQYDKNITDANFSNPSCVLKSGDKLHVRAFKQIVSRRTTTKERMDFCRKQKGNVFVGAQGVSLVWEKKRDQLPTGYWYTSFDEEDHLWKRAGDHYMPFLDASSYGDFGFELAPVEQPPDWDVMHVSLCFCKIK